MASNFNSSTSNDHHKYVNIHGREVRAVICEKTGEILIPLTEIKQTGFGIYEKSQYDKLLINAKQFNDEFNLYMLEAAKSYMLKFQFSFSENDIIKSINNCKKLLTEDKKQSPQESFFKDRLVEGKADDEIKIQVQNTSVRKSLNIKSPCKSPIQNGLPSEESHPRRSVKQRLGFRKLNESKTDTNQKLDETTPPKVRHPKSDILEKVSPSELKHKEHQVIVTCVDKRNCAWVRDKANDDIFERIHDMIKEEEKFQHFAFKPFKMEKVYMAQADNNWLRCKIIRFSPLTVFFLDYGNVSEVNEIKEVSQELAKIPCMAVRITFRESEYDPNLEDTIKIKIIKQNDDGTYFVNVLQSTRPKIKIPVPPKTKNYFKIPLPLCTVKNADRVIVIHEENGNVYLRTKECIEKLAEIEDLIEDYIKVAPPLQNVVTDQLVLCRNSDDDKFYRAVVTKVMDTIAEVKFIDYSEGALVDMDSLRNINEALSAEPVTCLGGYPLKGFAGRELGEESKNFILDVIEKKKKYSVVSCGDEIDLFVGTYMLSEKLQDLEKNSKKIKLQDMKMYKPAFGVKTYVCGCFKNKNDFWLVPSDEISKNADCVLRSEVSDKEHYAPMVGEVCLCLLIDHWYRCVVTRILNNTYEVLLLDFGSIELLKREHLRKADDNITDVPALALPCRFVDLPDHPKIDELLSHMVIDGELYNANVKAVTNGKYDVEIPLVYQNIKKK